MAERYAVTAVLTSPILIQLSTDERAKLQRVKYRRIICVPWRCGGCQNENLSLLVKSRLAKCGCGRVVVIKR